MSIRRAAADRALRGPGRPRPAFLSPPSALRRGALALACLLLGAAGPALVQAQPEAPAAAASAEAPEPVIVTVRVNGVERGEFTVLRTSDGDFWIAAGDLARMQLESRDAARRALDGESFYSARALGATTIRFDEPTLRLQLDFRADVLEGTRIDLSTRPQRIEPTPPATSLLLSYRLSAIRPARGSVTAQMATDLNVRVAGLLLRQEMRIDTGAPRRAVRGPTQVIWDRPRNATRLIAGDVVSAAGPYGSTITGGGVLFAKVYDLTPDVVRQPTATLRASTTLPADVEVSVDGTPLYRGHVGPGPITLDNVLLHGGLRNVRVVITDAAGRREVIEQPFLFTDSVLAKGFHEYSYFAGRRSELDETNVIRYREPAWQALHRYGVSDSLTVSAGGEGNADFYNAGAGIALRSDRLGLLGLDLLTSNDREAHRHALGWSGRYTWSSPLGSVVLGRRQFGRDFRSFDSALGAAFPRSETRVGLATSVGRYHLSADVVRTVTDRDVQDIGFLRLGTNLTRTVSLLAELQTTRIDDRKGWAANVYLRADLDQRRWVSSSARAGSDGRSLELQAGQQLPQGEGMGYRVGTLTTWNGGGTTTAATLAADWNLRPLSVGVFATSALGGGNPYLQADAAGALVGIGGYWGLTRQVSDSFALAQLGVPQPGVEVYLNNQAQGRTDAQGRLLIPELGSIGRQEISINDKDLAMQYTLPEKRRTIAPAFRSGSIVDFGIRQVRAAAGMAWLVEGGRRTPIKARSWGLAGPAGRLQIETGSAGDFYLEDAPPGRYTGILEAPGHRHACRLTVPAFSEPVHELEEGIVCE
ncbi:fimbria/pilus outer membrane usher protein [Ramlibacter sp. AN1133]|uniref:fimbria/pilus outer membrane usher protein n=1 Tax=Ramlibacter sp. AN1133 TaxID=3133429 RepID=UPI0030BAD4F6